MVYIVNKITFNEGLVKATIGYVEDKVAFEAIHGFVFIDWCNANPTEDKAVWFSENTHCYLINSQEDLPDGIVLITDLENPEGV